MWILVLTTNWKKQAQLAIERSQKSPAAGRDVESDDEEEDDVKDKETNDDSLKIRDSVAEEQPVSDNNDDDEQVSVDDKV